MSVVRAKFFVSKVENPEGAAAAQVHLGAVCRGVENAIWAQATPSGSITMNVLNTPAFEQFEQGAEYEVTFRKVPKPMPGDGHPIVEVADKYGRIVCETCGALTLGYTEEAVKNSPHLAEYNTEEKRAAARAQHEEHYGKRETQDA
jgi:hypothetical protein